MPGWFWRAEVCHAITGCRSSPPFFQICVTSEGLFGRIHAPPQPRQRRRRAAPAKSAFPVQPTYLPPQICAGITNWTLGVGCWTLRVKHSPSDLKASCWAANRRPWLNRESGFERADTCACSRNPAAKPLSGRLLRFLEGGTELPRRAFSVRSGGNSRRLRCPKFY
jgi:hypothetical protein